MHSPNNVTIKRYKRVEIADFTILKRNQIVQNYIHYCLLIRNVYISFINPGYRGSGKDTIQDKKSRMFIKGTRHEL